jgi:hypothetical protein
MNWLSILNILALSMYIHVEDESGAAEYTNEYQEISQHGGD